MDKLELYASELLMLKDLLEGDMEQTSYSGSEVEYDDVSLMQYYLDRAKVLVKVNELIGS
jgi:hypothetical protein